MIAAGGSEMCVQGKIGALYVLQQAQSFPHATVKKSVLLVLSEHNSFTSATIAGVKDRKSSSPLSQMSIQCSIFCFTFSLSTGPIYKNKHQTKAMHTLL